MTVCLYVGSPLSDCPLLCCGRTATEVSEEEGSYSSCFYRWCLESSKSCFLLLVALPSLIDTLAQLLAWRWLLWLSMTWRVMYLTSVALHLLFCFVSVRRSLFGGRKYTHTHTRAHTHTHTCTYPHTSTYPHTQGSWICQGYTWFCVNCILKILSILIVLSS